MDKLGPSRIFYRLFLEKIFRSNFRENVFCALTFKNVLLLARKWTLLKPGMGNGGMGNERFLTSLKKDVDFLTSFF